MKLSKYSIVILFVSSFFCATAQDGISYYFNKQYYGTYRTPNPSSKTFALDIQLSEITRMQIEGRIRDEKRRLGFKDDNLDDYYAYYGTAADEDEIPKSTSTNKPSNAPDKRYEALRWNNGDFYLGNTLNTMPHGLGTIKFASNGLIMKGEFNDGKANGLMEITGKDYVQKGKFVNNNPVGVQRYEFNDGKQNFVEIRDLDNGTTTIQYSDKSSFSGIVDDQGEYIKGKMLYKSGITFDGDFANGRPHKGIWQNEGRTMIGEFGENDETKNLYLKYGFHFSPKDELITFGHFNKSMKRINYVRQVSADNKVTHFIYGDNETEIYVFVHFPSGSAYWLKANQVGNDYLGTRYNKDTEEIEAILYSKVNGVQQLNKDHALYEKAILCSKEVTPAINAGKKEFEQKVSPFTKMIDDWLATN